MGVVGISSPTDDIVSYFLFNLHKFIGRARKVVAGL